MSVAGIVTSTTRPDNPYYGQQIFETDTGRRLIYYGASIGWRPPWNSVWGEVVSATIPPGDFQVNSGGPPSNQIVVANTPLSWTAILGRIYDYVFEWRVRYTSSSGSGTISSVAISTGAGSLGIAYPDPAWLIVKADTWANVQSSLNQDGTSQKIWNREIGLSGPVTRQIMSRYSNMGGSPGAGPSVVKVMDSGSYQPPTL
jgi:hypothetical protein